MSAKKAEKRPLSKKVVALNEQLQRRRGIRDLAKRFLIVCEDHKSAPDYFEALKKHFGLSAGSIQVVGSGGHSQPIQVVERAIDLKTRAAMRESGTEPFSQVWCVIDGDYGSKIANARSKALSHKINLAISTMCFEYWVILHFEDYDKATTNCSGLVRVLRKHIAQYEKGKCEFRPIVQNVHDACGRAEKLRRPGIARNMLPEKQNPCSEIYMLVRAIMET